MMRLRLRSIHSCGLKSLIITRSQTDADCLSSNLVMDGEAHPAAETFTSVAFSIKLFDAKFERQTERLCPPIALVISALSWKLAVSASTW